MSSFVRNGCLARFITTASGWVPVLTVPADSVVLLKRIDLFNNSGTSSRVILTALAETGGAQIALIDEDLVGGGFLALELWLGLNQGDKLQFFANISSVTIWCSGAALPGGFSTLSRAFEPVPLVGIRTK